jgi:hypothetical protein
MPQSTCPVTQAISGVPRQGIENLCARVEAEFREMPGLKLTQPQAARLFCLDPALCRLVLDALVDGGRLVTDGRVFARQTWRASH